MDPKTILIIMMMFVAVPLLVFMLSVFWYSRLWLRAFLSGAGLHPLALIVMRLRGVNPQQIVDAKIMSVQAGISPIRYSELETHALAGGDACLVVRALIAAKRANVDLD